ncbi:glycine/sarcosine/betaine reductase component B subunit [Chloroflexota bacterium]
MSLEIVEYPVNKVEFGATTRYENAELVVNKEELRSLVLQDSCIEEAEVELARPGEDVRITFLCDVVDARVKASGAGEAYPGTIGRSQAAGHGRTNVLTGLTVMAAGDIPSVFLGMRGALLDMHHPEPDSPFHHTHNLVIAFKFKTGFSDSAYHDMIQRAELRIANHLAMLTLSQEASSSTVYSVDQLAPELPRVVLVQNLRGHKDNPPHSIYGFRLKPGTFPIFVQPTEFLDGVVTTSPLSGTACYPSTWDWCNNDLIKTLCHQHGKTLNFLGAFVLVRPDESSEKELMSHRLGREVKAMGASGAIICSTGYGAQLADVMGQCVALEEEGVNTVVLTLEAPPQSVDSPRLAFLVPQANAIVSIGTDDLDLEYGPARRVIGPSQIPENMNIAPHIPRSPATGPFKASSYRPIFGSLKLFGGGYDTIREY